MTAPPAAPVVALFATSRLSEGALELLRVVAALVAADRPVRVLVTGPGAPALFAEDLPPEVERTIELLAGFGVVPELVDLASLARTLESAGAVLRVGEPDRAAEPPLLDLADPPADPAAWARAGQVVPSGAQSV